MAPDDLDKARVAPCRVLRPFPWIGGLETGGLEVKERLHLYTLQEPGVPTPDTPIQATNWG